MGGNQEIRYQVFPFATGFPVHIPRFTCQQSGFLGDRDIIHVEDLERFQQSGAFGKTGPELCQYDFTDD